MNTEFRIDIYLNKQYRVIATKTIIYILQNISLATFAQKKYHALVQDIQYKQTLLKRIKESKRIKTRTVNLTLYYFL